MNDPTAQEFKALNAEGVLFRSYSVVSNTELLGKEIGMATFVSTTLTKRTGATTTVFAPSGVSGGISYLRASASYAYAAPFISASAIDPINGGVRRTRVRVTIPQLDANDLVIGRPYGEVSLVVPESTLQTDIDDLVGYLNALTASSLTNFNDVLVNGVGMY